MFFKSSGKREKLTDQELIDAYKRTGDVETLGVLYARYFHLVYGVCLKYLEDKEESQDAVMQIFEKLLSELPKFEVRNFGSWLHVLTKNYCLMQLRASRAENRQLEKYSREKIVEFEHYEHPSEKITIETHLEVMAKCIEQLPEEQKKCVDLFYIKEKSYREIVEIAGYELKKVKSHLQNGKRNIKICIEKNIGK